LIHVTEELELYALGALAPVDAARVAAHLSECPACREQARAIDEVVQELPDTLPGREAPGGLRDRILASASAELTAARAPRRETAWTARLLRPALALGGAVARGRSRGAREREPQPLDQLRVVGTNGRHTSRSSRASARAAWWYMAARTTGPVPAERSSPRAPRSSAVCRVPRSGPLPQGQLYTIWLVSSDNTWVRGANFRPDGKDVQAVDVPPRSRGSTAAR